MQKKLETIGIVDWYNKEKGYGVLKNLHDQREYFIHQSKLKGQYKQSLPEGYIVLFSPDYDQKRNREIATNIHFFNNISNVQTAVNIWIHEDYLLDTYLGKIFRIYMKNFDKNEHSCFKDAFNHLIEIIWRYLEVDGVSVDLFLVLKKAIILAFEQTKSSKLLELAYLILMEKLSPNNYYSLLDSNISPYIYYVFALNAPDYANDAIQKVINYTKDTSILLDDLIRFAKNNNKQDIKDALDKDKRLITNIDYISGINGGKILSIIYRHLFSSCDSTTLKNLVEHGYIYNIDNPILKHNNPDCYQSMLIYAYKNRLVNHIDTEFIKENINEFTTSNLIELMHHCQLGENDVLDICLYLVRRIIISKQGYRDILNLATEIKDLHKWIKANHSYLAENAEADYQEFMIWLYKNVQIQDIDEGFVKYHIKSFSYDDIFRLLDNDLINFSVKESILSTLLKNEITSLSPVKINDVYQICNRAKELLKEHYTKWFVSLCNDLEDESKYILWKNKVSDIYPSTYIREVLLGSEEKGYLEFYELFQRQIVSSIIACNELWSILSENEIIENRPTFYKTLFCIKYLIKINSSYKEAIVQKNNDYYTLILWFLFYSSSFDYNLLCRLFIYFQPKDQVQIIKRLFFMAEEGQIRLNLSILNRLLRVDADLYRLISEQHPEIPIDVSSEVVIRSLINLSEKGHFSTDKDVLSIVISAGQYNKKEKFGIGYYFDDCKGRKTYRRNGNRRVNGCVKQINESLFSVEIYPYVEERGMGFNTDSVWNNSFHEAVNAVKNINGRRWNAEKSFWEVPIDEKDKLFETAKYFGFTIQGTLNAHMMIFKEENQGIPARIKYCEGRPALKPDSYIDKEFLWCRNSKCFWECVKEHSKEDWQNYTLLDFCRILGLETDSVDSVGRKVRYGKYLSFSSLINRANSIIEHLYCRECGDMLEPVETSNFQTYLVTHFHCTNASCGEFHKSIYISKCFNWKCNGVIDDRDIKKCPNGWNICPICGSCCSTRTAKQRVDNDIEIGKRPNPYMIDFVNDKRGHLEKREFYCWKCGERMSYIGDNVYECNSCRVRYDRKKFDFEPRYKPVSS